MMAVGRSRSVGRVNQRFHGLLCFLTINMGNCSYPIAYILGAPSATSKVDLLGFPGLDGVVRERSLSFLSPSLTINSNSLYISDF